MPRAVAYIRASTADQTQTLDAQRERIAAWAAREGVEVVGFYTDAGVSGITPAHKRAGLGNALVAVEDSGASLLLVTTRDRLARSALDAALLDRDLAKLRARVVATDGDAATPTRVAWCEPSSTRLLSMKRPAPGPAPVPCFATGEPRASAQAAASPTGTSGRRPTRPLRAREGRPPSPL
jgi:hypothetical protein